MKTALSIAGSDCSGGAGIQADIKTMSALGVYAMSVITAVVAENTSGVVCSEPVSPRLVGRQLDAVFSDISTDAVKIGMLPSEGCMEVVSDRLKRYAPKFVVADPVLRATDGTELCASAQSYLKFIAPLSTLITPNIPEAEQLTGLKIDGDGAAREAAKRLVEAGAKAALIKGGHRMGEAIDILYDGKKFFEFSHKRIESDCTHGTGCTLSSAITAYLALGLSLSEAVKRGKEYVSLAIQNGLRLGKGHGPTHHFFEFYTSEGKRK